MSENRQHKPVVERISVQKSYDLLAGRLRDSILDGDLQVGDRLPSERELVAQSGLSRGSVREAIRVLEVEGLVQSRPGRNGGITVTRPDNSAMASFVDRFVRSRRLPRRVIQETRETIEPALARFAALNRTEEELERIVALNERLVDPTLPLSEFIGINTAWHRAVAAASHNDLLAALLYAMSQSVIAATSLEHFNDPAIRAVVYKTHARIIAAIAEGDGDAAYRRMERHMLATRAESEADANAEFILDGAADEPMQI